MKKLILLSLAIVSIFAADFTNAAPVPESPASALKAFFVCLTKADFVNAKTMIKDKVLQDMLVMLEGVCKESPELKGECTAEFLPYANARIISEKITGNDATVTIAVSEDGKIKKETYKLTKVSGKWIIVE